MNTYVRRMAELTQKGITYTTRCARISEKLVVDSRNRDFERMHLDFEELMEAMILIRDNHADQAKVLAEWIEAEEL